MNKLLNKKAVVDQILKGKTNFSAAGFFKTNNAQTEIGTFFAPANIALCKYWGKRNTELNLPYTSSLSVSLGRFGATTTIAFQEGLTDTIWVNGQLSDPDSNFSKKISEFLDLFRFQNNDLNKKEISFLVKTRSTVPIGAGLASSASGFAALVGALDVLYGWNLSLKELSLLARLGSGSASRSFWQGFVEWKAGIDVNGMDSIGSPMKESWPELRIGLMILNRSEKPISSRIAMENTVLTSPFYAAWPEKQAKDLEIIKTAISQKDFNLLGETVELNALAMHALMLSTVPPILYSEPATIIAMRQVWEERKTGLPIYFTQDAGPNLKLLFLAKDQEKVLALFPQLEVIAPFAKLTECAEIF